MKNGKPVRPLKASYTVRAILLDRDGVINRKAAEGEYVTKVADFKILPQAAEAIAELVDCGYEVFIVTNQRGVKRGMIDSAELGRIHSEMIRTIEQAGGRIRQIYVCPHDYADACDCRKPKPGLLLEAIRDHQIDPAASWMIGDSASDMIAGRAAGCKTFFVGSETAGVKADASAASLADAVRAIRTFGNIPSERLHE